MQNTMLTWVTSLIGTVPAQYQYITYIVAGVMALMIAGVVVSGFVSLFSGSNIKIK